MIKDLLINSGMHHKRHILQEWNYIQTDDDLSEMYKNWNIDNVGKTARHGTFF